MASLLVVTGPPGAGKSTVSALLADGADRSVLVEGDRFFGFLAAGAIEPWRSEAHQQNLVVTEAAAVAAGRFASEFETVYEGVLGPWFLPTFARATGLSELDYVIVLPSAGACAARVRSRAGHSFTDEHTARELHHQFATSQIERRHVLRGDFDQPAETVSAIHSLRERGVLRYAIDA
ncbi:MAG: ATP-binding protein [Actinomycetota bacterium]